ncbi:phage tail sheath family protein [Elioraea sp.]|uniref:phage tail sheath family protein n=1 Tax=Elioraea sp. TaxID=2185103 RepID=UPI003F6F102B
MPVNPTYPGVYIEEVPSGVRTVVGVATSIGAFVDGFARGPQNVALRVFGMADFAREFGGLHRDSPGSYAVRQFFENGGSEAHIVRVASDDADPAEATLTDGSVGDAGASDMLSITAGRQVRGQTFPDPGLWANNLYVEIDYDCANSETQFNLTVSEIVEVAGRRTTARTETFRNLTLTADVEHSADAVVNAASRLVTVEMIGAAPDRPASSGTRGAALPAAPPAAAATLTLSIDAGSGAQAFQVDRPAGVGWAQVRPLLESAIRGVARTAGLAAADRDALAGATVRLLGNGTSATPFRFHVSPGRGGAAPLDARLEFAGADVDNLGLGTGALANDGLYRLAGGSNGTLPVADTTLTGDPATKTGLYALEDVDLFNILCVPRAADLPASSMRAVYSEVIGYAERRRAFVLVDIPATVNDLDRALAWLSDNEVLRHRNAAVFFPRTRVPDPLNGNRPQAIATSGTIAGLFARTDAARGVWKAPAGTDARLRNVDSLDYLLTDPQNGVLNPLGVNCLRSFPIYGTVAWGSRTLEGADALASEWKYVPVRRFTLFLEETLYRGTQWVVFEPNDEPLWAQIRLNLGAFMQGLFRQGAFQGTTPREAFFVKCDRETTTQDDINRGVVNILVGFAPLKPAEFVIIRIQQMAGQIEA